VKKFSSQGNVVISPLSAYLALAMARIGAKGQTELELSRGMGLGSNEANAQGFNDLLDGFSVLIII
jgi:serine protease inhibitor